MLIFVFFCNIIKVNQVLYRFITLLYLISSFLLPRSLLIPYTYVSVKSINCILLSSFELKAILLISSVKTLCLSLLNLCCVFNIILLFFYLGRVNVIFLDFLVVADGGVNFNNSQSVILVRPLKQLTCILTGDDQLISLPVP